jgi:MinD-like ATPase involved in chromosome partitioning or flagellar assembly
MSRQDWPDAPRSRSADAAPARDADAGGTAIPADEYGSPPDGPVADRVPPPAGTAARPHPVHPVLIAGSAPGTTAPVLIAGAVPGMGVNPVLVAGEVPRPPGEPVIEAAETASAPTVPLAVGLRPAGGASADAPPVEHPDRPDATPLPLRPSTTGTGDPAAADSRSPTAAWAPPRSATAPSLEPAARAWTIADRPARTGPVADDMDAAWWHEPPVAPPIVAFISGTGGTGVTTTATGAGLALATVGPIALVDVGAGHASVAPRAAVSGVSLADVARDPRLAIRSSPAAGLQTIDGGDRWSADPGVVRTALQALTGLRTTVLLDVGNDASVAARAGLAAADRVVLVTNLSHVALDAAAATVQRLTLTAPEQARNLVVAVVLTRRRRAARVERHLRTHLPDRAGSWVVVPHDRGAARDGPLDPQRLRGRTMAAYDALAGLLR